MTRPQMIEVKRLPDEKKLRLSWDDDFTGEIEYDRVRGFCPCAGCQGHGTGKVEFRPPAAPVQPLSIRLVGNYAISIQWSDGHDTGIYRFEFLRKLIEDEAEAS